MKRGKANAHRAAAVDLLGSHSITISPTSLDEVDVAEIVHKVKRAATIDGEESKEGECVVTVDAFMAALLEEQSANSHFFGDSVRFACLWHASSA